MSPMERCKIRFAPVNRFDRNLLMNRIFLFRGIAWLAIGLSASVIAKSPQPKLPTISIEVAGIPVEAEVADTDESRATGMMFRSSMGENEGMLFVMDAVGPVSFWMKNTLIPLSIAYINATGVILEIHEMQPLNEESVESRFSTIAYALEMPGGWFQQQGIKPGASVKGLPPSP